MQAFRVDLKKEYGFLQGGVLENLIVQPTMDNVVGWKRPAVIVVPGGGYRFVSKREGTPIALEFLSKGFQTFVLEYMVAGEGGVSYPEQLLELASAVDYVKKHADELYVNANEVFVIGFSAGGHLVANLAVEHQNVSEKAGVELDCKPTAVGLGYPVIFEDSHKGSFDNLLYGYTDEAREELLKTLNLHKAVNRQTPPAFIWTTAGDNAVKPSASLQYALALEKRKIPYELHVYPQGIHGISTADLEINAPSDCLKKIYGWTDDCAEFFRLFTSKKFKM